MLKLLVFLPVAGAVLTAAVPTRHAQQRWFLALVVTVAALALTVFLAVRFDPTIPGDQFALSSPWNARLGSYFALGLDGISLAMVGLTALLTLVAVLASHAVKRSAQLYFPLLLLLESAMFGVFLARDWSLFYVFWEATLIPLFFLIDRLGGENRQRAALNFFLYTLGGSVFMLVGLLFLYDAAPGHSFAMADMAAGGQRLGESTQLLIFLGLFIGFAVKMPVFPLHGWLPLAHVEAPGPVSILLSGVLLKMGAYGLIRAAETLPAALLALQGPLFGLGLFSLLYGAMLAWRQQDLKAMVAYSSISHMGIVVIGIASLQPAALQGALLQMVAHGLLAAALFLLVNALYQRTHSRDLADYGPLTNAPRFAFFTPLFLLCAIGLPGSAGFMAELHVLIGGWQQFGGIVTLACLGLLIGAAYALRALNRLCQPGDPPLVLVDMTASEATGASLLAVGLISLGVWPRPLLDWMALSVQRLGGLYGG